MNSGLELIDKKNISQFYFYRLLHLNDNREVKFINLSPILQAVSQKRYYLVMTGEMISY